MREGFSMAKGCKYFLILGFTVVNRFSIVKQQCTLKCGYAYSYLLASVNHYSDAISFGAIKE